VITKTKHEKLVEEGIEIVEEVNSTLPEVDEKTIFYVMGDTKVEGLKFRSYWFKVRCRVCGFMCQLCPPKKTLHMNLMNHVEGFKHTKMLDELSSSSKTSGSALSIGRRGRPSKSSGSFENGADLHGFFKRCIPEGDEGKCYPIDQNSNLSFMC
jgi:hypothetical protein